MELPTGPTRDGTGGEVRQHQDSVPEGFTCLGLTNRGGWDCTNDLQVMSLASCYCSTPLKARQSGVCLVGGNVGLPGKVYIGIGSARFHCSIPA